MDQIQQPPDVGVTVSGTLDHFPFPLTLCSLQSGDSLASPWIMCGGYANTYVCVYNVQDLSNFQAIMQL